MPLQNRVSPFGAIVADPARGLFMGNRGILHDDRQELGTARWRHPNWVTCTLSFRARKRTLMASRHYTELFFLDEATALAAGHRPCAECRRADYNRFAAAWMSGNASPAKPPATAMDGELHRARVTRARRQVTFEAPADELPDGTMIAADGEAWLIRGCARHRWRHDGYGGPERLPDHPVTVLTPRPTVETLRAGYAPVVHPTAGST